jgi:Uma2 family endonuclease
MTRTTTPRPTARARRVAASTRTAAAPSPPVNALGDQWFVIPSVSWEGYVSFNDAVISPAHLRMIYCEGRLTLLTESRKHGWYSRCLYSLVVALAGGLRMNWEPAATATYRKQEKEGGVEGDETFYFGQNAEIMKGPKDIDLNSQPPPDLAVEVEVSHSADDAVLVWGRLGVPEVWRFDPIAMECSFWKRRRQGDYAEIKHSIAFPMLNPDDVLAQIRLAVELGAADWHAQLDRWVRKVVVPRTRGGAR